MTISHQTGNDVDQTIDQAPVPGVLNLQDVFELIDRYLRYWLVCATGTCPAWASNDSSCFSWSWWWVRRHRSRV